MFEGVGMTDFCNVKLKVLSPEHSAAFQEAAFDAGVRWEISEHMVQKTGAKYLFISDGPYPRLTWDDDPLVFENSEREEILFTTPAYLNTKIQIRDKMHLDFVLEKLKQNGVQGAKLMKELAVRDGDYIVVTHDGFCGAVAREMISNLSRYKEIFIEKDDIRTDDTTTTISKLVVDVETDVATRFIDTETSDGSTASYYELPSGATELQHLISHKNMNFFVGLIFCLCYDYSKDGHSNIRTAMEIEKYATAEVERLEGLQDMQRKQEFV